MPVDFVHLHNHTDYSFLDGASKTTDLARVAAEMDMKAVAMTDHGNLCGAVEFYTNAKKFNVKPIIGSELYLTAGSHKEKGKDVYGNYTPIYHLPLIIKDKRGWHSLSKLSSAGYVDGFYRKPRIDYDLLEKYHEGLICLSGCIQGHVCQTILNHGIEKGAEIAQRYKDIFGDDYYFELQNHGIDDEDLISKALLELSQRMNIKTIVTNDAHYPTRHDAEAHDILLCVQTKADRYDKNRFKFPGDEFYLKSYDEMTTLFPDHPEALKNTVEIADKVDFDFDFKAKHFPRFPLPKEEEHLSLDDYLMKLCEEGLPQRYNEITDEIRERLDYEMGIIIQKQLSSYFLIVRDFIHHAKTHDIPVGPGRGSAAGCLVSYLIGITNIDPIKYDLLFERFINPERESYPDIDVDFSDQRRQEVIEYVRKKYGESNVCQIMTYGRMLSKGAVRDVGRVIGIPISEVNAICKLIPDGAKTLDEAMDVADDLKKMIDSKAEYQEMMNIATSLEGTIRNAGIHAAGVIITPRPVDELVPLYKAPDGEPTTQFDMTNAEKLGLLKVDFLGLKTLSILERAVNLIKKKGIDIDLDEIPVDDKETYELFARGETIGIFQFESSGMRENLRKLRPTRLEDLTAMNALYRPGPMDNIGDFCARKHGTQKISYINEKLAPILDETYGIIVYQEQVMRIANILAGFSLGKADILRKAMGKKKLELMNQMKPEFIDGCGKNDIPKSQANELWDLIVKFASYGFNKSHAAGYALVAYQTGYLKCHYPAEFMAASMTTRAYHTDELILFLEECKRMGLNVIAPDINVSSDEFSVSKKGDVVFGLSAIKNVGSSAIQAIEGERETRDGGFRDIFDLADAVVKSPLINKKVLETLIYAGAMRSLEGHRAQQLAMLEPAIAYAQRLQEEKNRGQFSIFGDAEDGGVEIPRPELPDVPEMPHSEILTHEKDLLGIYFSGHPLMAHKHAVNALSSCAISELCNLENEATVRIAGMLQACDRRQTRKGDIMAKGKFEDLTGAINLLIFPKSYEQLKEKLEARKPFLITGKVQLKDDENELFVEDAVPLDEAVERMVRKVEFDIDPQTSESIIPSLLPQFKENEGNARVVFVFSNGNGERWRCTSKRYSVNPTAEMITAAEEVLGSDKVRISLRA